MGLDTSHDCWSGGYVSFNTWRTEVARAAGFPDLNDMEGYGGETEWLHYRNDALVHLLHHSDCDGEIAWQNCEAIADRLEEILPSMQGFPGSFALDLYRTWTKRFVAGLRVAAAAQENIEFH